MPIRSRISLKIIAILQIALVILGLAGCAGTAQERSHHRFGISPIPKPIVVVSLPLALAISIAIVPIALPIAYLDNLAFEKRYALYRQKYDEKFRRMCFKGINLSNSYRIYYKAVRRYATLIGAYDGSDINIEECWGNYIPRRWQEELAIGIEWEEGRTDKKIRNYAKEGSKQWIEYKEEHGEDDLRYQQLLKPPYYNEQTKAIVIVFLPCHQLMAVAVSEDVITSKTIDSAILTKRYKELKEQAKNNQCPVLPYPASTKERYPINSFDKEEREVEKMRPRS